jgi:hypothetical protein
MAPFTPDALVFFIELFNEILEFRPSFADACSFKGLSEFSGLGRVAPAWALHWSDDDRCFA